MNKNHKIRQVAEVLGVEIDEIFRDQHGKSYKLTITRGLMHIPQNNKRWFDCFALEDFIYGYLEEVKTINRLQ